MKRTTELAKALEMMRSLLIQSTLLAPAMSAAGLQCGGSNGCDTAVQPCNASDPMQLWRFRPLPAQASLQLRVGSTGDNGPCLNVAKYGTSVGDDVWCASQLAASADAGRGNA